MPRADDVGIVELALGGGRVDVGVSLLDRSTFEIGVAGGAGEHIGHLPFWRCGEPL